MVNFNNDTTIGTSATDIMRVLILEKRTNIIEALENINKKGLTDVYDLHILKARIQSLYWELEGMLFRNMKPEELIKLKENVFNTANKKELLLETFSNLNMFLDTLQLTRIDTRINVDRKRVENVNTANHI